MKGTKANLMNNNMFDVDSCGLPQVTEDSIIDEQLSWMLDKELSNITHNNSRKIMQHEKFNLMSRQALNKNEILWDGFAIKLNDVELDKK